MAIRVFDFFSGCGGTSKGFQCAEMEIIWAIDSDKHASATFQRNFADVYFEKDKIEHLDLASLQPFIDGCGNEPILFSGCAPCQPYSQQNKQNDPEDHRRTLLEQFSRFVEHYLPEYVFVENVPGIQRADPEEDSPFGHFLSMLQNNGYHETHEIIASQDFGVPQKRRRLVLIASRLGPIGFPQRTHGRGTDNPEYSSVRDWIYVYNNSPIAAGEAHPDIPNHQAASISGLNLERLRHTPMGGDRRDWPEELLLDCHAGHKGHTDVYGRLSWDTLASCLTTKCTSISNGRFGHPEQDRAISGREAASLQTFPNDFVFAGGTNAVARQIGNAVPVLLAQRFGENFMRHYRAYLEETNG
jgi:DNA (cytosine-5)-methyltransferase 1